MPSSTKNSRYAVTTKAVTITKNEKRVTKKVILFLFRLIDNKKLEQEIRHYCWESVIFAA